MSRAPVAFTLRADTSVSHRWLPGYVPVWAIPVHVTNPDEARVLADLEVSLRECRALGMPWRVDAAFIAATATVLDALGEVRHA